jgi:PAS domain S-box-containing protein
MDPSSGEPLSAESFMPHGHCYLWQTDIICLHVVSDALIALSYLTIPLTLYYFVRRRRDLPFRSIFWAFSAFIVSCGMTHLLEIWTLWSPAYWLSGGVKALTALASVATAALLVGLVPRALALPSTQELRTARDELKRAEERLRAATDGMIEAFLIFESVRDSAGAIVDFRIVEANPAMLSRLRLSHADALGTRLSALAAPAGTFERLRGVVTSRVRIEDDIKIDLAWTHHQVVALADGVAVTSRDITEKVAADAALARLASIVESTSDAIVGKDADGVIETWNAGAERLYGYTAAEVVGQSVRIVVPPERAEEDRQLLERIQRGERVEVLDTIRTRKDGQTLEVSVTASPIHDVAGKVVGISTITRDISQQKKNERLVHAEVLLKEIHHRVKNNLQVISSLLKLHAEQISDPLGRAAFLDAQDRVRAIALLHERLHQSKTPGDVDVADYAESLIPTLLRAYARRPVGTRVETNAIVLPVDVAVPFGLILNELVTNAVKHAFDDDAVTSPRIDIVLEADGPDFVLTVRDNGRGFPAGLDVATSTRLGMHIVRTLTRQLGGTLELRSASGAQCRLRFPQPSAERDAA